MFSPIFIFLIIFISFNTGITNSLGVAEVTVSVSANTTFTCSYSNVSDTCTVNVPQILFYDDCSSSAGLTDYGSYISLRNNGTCTLAYDSTNQCYKLTNTKSSAEAFLPIDAIEGTTDSFKFTEKGVCWGNTLGLVVYFDSSNFYCVKVADSYEVWVTKKVSGTYSETSYTQSTSYKNKNVIVECTVDNSNHTLSIDLYDENGNFIVNESQSIPSLSSSCKYGFSSTWNNNAYSLITEIKAEYI